MKCEDARRTSVERLTGDLDRGRADALDRHLESCAACAAEARELRALWDELGALPEPAPDPETLARIERRLASTRSGSDPSSGPPIWSAITGLGATRVRRDSAVLTAAAALVIGFLGGALATRALGPSGSGATDVTGSASVESTARFLLLLEPPEGGYDPGESPEVRAARIRDYADWAADLDRTGHLVMAEKLADAPTRRLVGRDGPVSPARPGARAARISGLFLIRARDLDRATEIARGGPHLRHGGTIVIRRIEETP